MIIKILCLYITLLAFAPAGQAGACKAALERQDPYKLAQIRAVRGDLERAIFATHESSEHLAKFRSDLEKSLLFFSRLNGKAFVLPSIAPIFARLSDLSEATARVQQLERAIAKDPSALKIDKRGVSNLHRLQFEERRLYKETFSWFEKDGWDLLNFYFQEIVKHEQTLATHF